MNRWPHQVQGVQDTLGAFHAGSRAVVLTTPTGGGKTLMMADLAEHFLSADQNVVLYTDRTMLREQLSATMRRLGLEHGVRAAGHARTNSPFQLSSIQTEGSRVLRRQSWGLCEASLVLIDEAHKQTAGVARKLIQAHIEQGAYVCGLTATPLDLQGLYDTLIQAGTMSSLRMCGACVFARHYAPDEPDLRALKVAPGEALSETQNVQAMGTAIYARVLTEFERLNPHHGATILFAPGVQESRYFAEMFEGRGIASGHIDGTEVVIRGKRYPYDQQAREELLGRFEDGSIRVVCNRFVLREGIDCPWVRHGIFACVFGDLGGYVQAGGRLLRAHPGIPSVSIQDHGGNWWRHGSLNADRAWRLGDTGRVITASRFDRLREKCCGRCGAATGGERACPQCGEPQETEPRRCPECQLVLNGSVCPCGYAGRERVRMVVQVDGTLKEQHGFVFRPRGRVSKPDTFDLWKKAYYRARNGKMTWLQAEALFFTEHGYYPPRTLPLMPRCAHDWHRRVADLLKEELR